MSRASEYANAVSSLYAKIGEARGREAANKGEIWSGALANIGDFVAQYPERQARMKDIENRAEETKLRREQMEREAKRQQRQDDIDQAFRDIFTQSREEFESSQSNTLPDGTPIAMDGPGTGGIAGNDPTLLRRPKRMSPLPTPGELMRIDPKRGLDMIKGLEALQRDDPKTEADDLKAVAFGLNALPEDMRATAYPGIVQNYPPAKRLLDAGKLRPDYDPTYWKFIMGTGQEPTKPKEPELVAQPGPDGKPVYGPKVAGAPVYEKPIVEGGTNPTETTLALAAAKGDKDAARALQVLRQQRASEGGQEPLVAVMKDGKPVLVRRSQAEGQTPATSREQGRPVTSGDANKLTDLDSSLRDLDVIGRTLGSEANATGIGAQVGAALPNWATNLTGWGVDAKKKQAVIDRVKQVIGKALEGGVLRKEDELKYAKILPTIGDPPPVVKTKLAGLTAAITQRKTTLLENLSDAGYETGKFEQRGTQPAKADPLGIR